MTRPPARRADIAPFLAMEVRAEANRRERAGQRILHLEVGQPGGRPPARALAALRDALDRELLGYTEACGRPSLRAALARHYLDQYGVAVAPERIAVTMGSSAGFVLAFLASFDPGARIGYLVPGYPAYPQMLTALGLVPVPIRVTAEEGWQPDPARLAAALAGLDGLIVASPANPTGAVLAADALGAIARACAAASTVLIVDEVYHGLTYAGPAASILQVPWAEKAQAWVLNSFSKYYAMPGWRVGWLVAPDAAHAAAVERLSQNLFVAPPTPAQLVAEAALACRDELDERVAAYGVARGRLLAALPALGFGVVPTDGAFYSLAELPPHLPDSPGFCRSLLEATGVALTPGIDFDPERGHRFLRVSYAGPLPEIEAALALLAGYLRPA